MLRALRSLGIRRSDRVAVVLPNGPEAATASIAVAAGAVCVPLNPGFTADEWRHYLRDLRVSALLTRADMDSASREVADALGIFIIDVPLCPSTGSLRLVRPTKGTIAAGEPADGRNSVV
jgi:acyl-CoA synthetase (AMP-forming)/AMP-acid ligase II